MMLPRSGGWRRPEPRSRAAGRARTGVRTDAGCANADSRASESETRAERAFRAARPPPPRPIPWEQIRALDRRTESHLTPILFGATVGALFCGGIGFGLATLGNVSGAWSYGVGGLMIGGVAGGLVASPFRSSEWVSEYPREARATRDRH